MEKIRLNNKLSGRNSNLQAQKRDMLPKMTLQNKKFGNISQLVLET